MSAAHRHTSEQPSTSAESGLRQRAAYFWLTVLFALARNAPWLVRPLRAPAAWLVMLFSRKVRTSTDANARRLFGDTLSTSQRRQFGRRVVGSFYDFVYDVGRSVRADLPALDAQIERIDGEAHYLNARALRRGVIVVTAHMGSFEAGMAALLRHERAGTIHVLFKRDAVGGFETLRSSLRQRLGVIEAPLDAGWSIWVRLRDALRDDHVVLLQGDRCIAGQKGMPLPALGGHLILPTGPVKLALASGAVIVPVYSIRAPDGRVRIVVDEMIDVDPQDEIDIAMQRIAASIEQQLRLHPEQWLVLEKAFVEDNDSAASSTGDARGVS